MRLGEIGGLLVAAAIVTTTLFSVAEARDIRITRKPAVTERAPAAVAIVRDVTPQAKPAAAQASLPVQTTESPACARKVKVIYAGYGEAERVNCTLASAEMPAIGLRTATP